MLKNLLLYRFMLVNILAVGALVAALEQGYVQYIVDNDSTRISFAIAMLFIMVFWWTFRWICKINKVMNKLRLVPAHSIIPSTAWLRDATSWMFGLGLIGTVIGFSIALSGVDPSGLMDASGVKGSVGSLVAGMRVALTTTIAGAILGMWNEVNQRILSTATECIVSRMGQ